MQKFCRTKLTSTVSQAAFKQSLSLVLVWVCQISKFLVCAYPHFSHRSKQLYCKTIFSYPMHSWQIQICVTRLSKSSTSNLWLTHTYFPFAEFCYRCRSSIKIAHAESPSLCFAHPATVSAALLSLYELYNATTKWQTRAPLTESQSTSSSLRNISIKLESILFINLYRRHWKPPSTVESATFQIPVLHVWSQSRRTLVSVISR